jgi:hypothetical protein
VVVKIREGKWFVATNYQIHAEQIHDVGHKLNDSPMWSDLLKVKHIYLQGRGLSTKNGKMTRFWQDPWVYNEPLSSHAPMLFELCENKSMTVAQALNGEPILFRRWLYQELRVQWEVIWEDANNFQLEDSADVVFWNLGKTGKYSVKSVYDGLTKNDCGFFP